MSRNNLAKNQQNDRSIENVFYPLGMMNLIFVNSFKGSENCTFRYLVHPILQVLNWGKCRYQGFLTIYKILFIFFQFIPSSLELFLSYCPDLWIFFKPHAEVILLNKFISHFVRNFEWNIIFRLPWTDKPNEYYKKIVKNRN